MPNLKPMEILLILLVVLLLFGAKRLPDLAQSVGRSLRILKSEVKDPGDDGRPAQAAPSGPATSRPAAAPMAADPRPLSPADDNDRRQV